MPVEKEARKKELDTDRMSKIAVESGYKYAYPVMVGRNNYIILSNERTGTSFHDIRVAAKEDRLLKPDGAMLGDRDKEKLRTNMLGAGVPKVAERVVEEKAEETKTDYSFSFKDTFDAYTQNRVESELGKDGFEALEAHINGNYAKVEALAEKNRVMQPDFAWKTQIIAECLETDKKGNQTLHGKGANTIELMKESAYPEDKVYDPSKKAVNVVPMDITGETYQFLEKYLGPEMVNYAYEYFNKPDEFKKSVAPARIGGMTRIFEKMAEGPDGMYYIPAEDLKDLEERMEKVPDVGYTIAEKKEVVGPEKEEYPEEIEEESKVAEVIKPEKEYPEEIEESEEKVAEVIGPEEKKPGMIAKKEEYPEEIEEELEKAEVIMPEKEEKETMVAKKEEYPEGIELEAEKTEVIGPEEEKPAMIAKKEEYPEEIEEEKKAEAVIGPEEKEKPVMVASKDEEIDIMPAMLEKEVKSKEFGAGEKAAAKTKPVTLLVVGPEGTKRQKIVAEFDAEFYSKNIATAENQRVAVLANIDNAVNITLDGKKISSEEAEKLIKSG